MTQFVYGGFRFDPNEVAIASFTSEFVRSPSGSAHLLRKSLGINGKIIRNSMPAVMLALDQRQVALSVNGYPAAMLDNDGNITPWVLDSASAVGGVIVTRGVTNENVTGAQGVTYLKYNFALQADYLWAGSDEVLEFSETLDFTDNRGLPLQSERVPSVGRPIIQNTTESSFFFATQSGTLKQAGANPSPMPPIFPGFLRGIKDSYQVTYLPTTTVRGVPIEYGVSWKYQFISIDPFAGWSLNVK